MQINDCWQYRWALIFRARSFAIAGCYKVESGQGEMQVELNDLLKHTAQAAVFVMKHLFSKDHLTKDNIFFELKRHDEGIRAI